MKFLIFAPLILVGCLDWTPVEPVTYDIPAEVTCPVGKFAVGDSTGIHCEQFPDKEPPQPPKAMK